MSQLQVDIPMQGYSVAADWYEGAGDEVTLFLIGFNSDRERYGDFARALIAETGSSVLVLEYSGHGTSKLELGEITPAQHFLEVITAFDWLAEKYPDKKINVIGTSYGGFMATQLTKYRAFPKLVLRVPAIYPPDVFYDKLKIYEGNDHFKEFRSKSTDELAKHPLLERARKFAGKSLVVTHEFDDVCPPNETSAFTRSFSADHWEAKGFKHGFGESEVTEEQKQEYYQKIAEWLK